MMSSNRIMHFRAYGSRAVLIAPPCGGAIKLDEAEKSSWRKARP
jgi:hypothetical protein